MLITQDRLKEKLLYDPITGVFTTNIKGTITGYAMENGYLQITVDNNNYYAHRLVWFYMYGVWPEYIDHIDGIRSNNKLSNLRNCTKYQNNQNTLLKSSNRSGFKGVSYAKLNKKWRATITINSKQKCLGLFEDPVEAANAYDSKAVELYGNFAKTNKSLGLIP